MKFCYTYLTCDAKQADELIDALLQKRLIVCAKKIPVSGAYWWEGSIEKADEIMLVMESAEEMFDDIEALCTQMHSYDTFVLTAVPMVKVSKGAEAWLRKNLKGAHE